MTSPLVRFIERHQDDWDGPVYWLYPCDLEATLQGVRPLRGDRVWVDDCRFLGPLAALGIDAGIGLLPAELDTCAHIVIQYPRARAWFEAVLECAATAPPTATIWVMGHNRSGINSALPAMERVLARAEPDDHARHCVLLKGRPQREGRATAWPPAFTTWADAATGDLQVHSLPGVFSHGHLDAGTRILLQHLPPLRGRVMDMACGAGVLAAVAARQGATVTAVDASVLAVESAQATLAAASLKADIYLSDAWAAVKGTFDLVLCNPPFHQGSDVDITAASDMLGGAARHLSADGELWVVANAFLPYPKLLESHFGSVSSVASDGRFRVYRARSPRVS